MYKCFNNKYRRQFQISSDVDFEKYTLKIEKYKKWSINCRAAHTTVELEYIGSLQMAKSIRYIRNPIYTRKLLLFCTMETEHFIRYSRLFDITESDIFEFYCTVLLLIANPRGLLHIISSSKIKCCNWNHYQTVSAPLLLPSRLGDDNYVWAPWTQMRKNH